MKKFLVILWVVGIFAVFGQAQTNDNSMEEEEESSDEMVPEETEEEEDDCIYHCEEEAEDEDECCEGKTCKSFEGIQVKFCQSPEEYQQSVNFRKSFGMG